MNKYIFFLLGLFGCQNQKATPPAAIEPIPSERQLAWHELEYYAFVHFNMNTFSDMEWGMGDENPSQFNPTALDTRQWAKTVKEAGMKGIIITAKHHDGFCLWPSAYTAHSVKNSPWREGKGDLIRELADACKEYDLKFGIYYSPWDRNHAAYGKPEYITYMRNQLAELLTRYGDIFELWFDGANGGTGYYGGANEERRVDKKTYYDWQNTISLVRDLQPKTVIFGDAGPDVRWVGNEHGFAYETTWSNLLRDSVYAGMPEYAEEYASGQENGTHWVPAEADVSIRPGWYYHAYEDHKVKTIPQLLEIYYKSIGRNSSLLINFPVDRRGLIHEKDVSQILKLADKLKEDFEVDLIHQAEISASNDRGPGYAASLMADSNFDSYWASEDDVIENSIYIDFPEPTTINRFIIQEYIPLGQRIKAFSLEAETDDGWKKLATGTTVGAKRILRFEDVTVNQLRFVIEDAKASPTIAKLGVYRAPKLVIAPEMKREISGAVTLYGPDKGVAIRYTLDGSEPDEKSLRYENPFDIFKPLTVKAISIDQETGNKSEVVTYHIDIPKSNWRVLHENANASKAIDEDPDSFWQSSADEIVIDLGDQIQLRGFTYLPPQNRYMSGIILEYLFQTSEDGKNWVVRSMGEFANIKNNPIEQSVTFEPASARFIRIKSKQTTDGKPASFGEVGVLSN